MARPRVFISSTFYDLKYVRADIERFIKEMGYDPVLNERGNISYGSDERLEEYCYKEVEITDIFIAIVGGRYGSNSFNSEYSVTQMEIKTALKQGKQVYIFIDKSVYSEYHTYLNNIGVENIRYSYVDDPKVYSFIQELDKLPQNNPISTFEHSNEITSFLKEQWAGLFQRFLQQQSRQLEVKTIESINATAKTLNQLVNFLTDDRKNSDHAIKEILISNHPIFDELRSATNTPYPIFFRNKIEMESWLEARGHKTVDVADDDYFGYMKKLKDKKARIIIVSRKIFDENDKLIVFTADEWNDDWVSVEEISLEEEINDDDLPF